MFSFGLIQAPEQLIDGKWFRSLSCDNKENQNQESHNFSSSNNLHLSF
jgi:hypothetical protein